MQIASFFALQTEVLLFKARTHARTRTRTAPSGPGACALHACVRACRRALTRAVPPPLAAFAPLRALRRTA
jgi:hypothetical protein